MIICFFVCSFFTGKRCDNCDTVSLPEPCFAQDPVVQWQNAGLSIRGYGSDSHQGRNRTFTHLQLSGAGYLLPEDYSGIVNGTNPLIVHDFCSSSVEGMDVIVVDDVIASGGSMPDTARQLKDMGAKRVFVFSTFGLFTSGSERFDKAWEDGWFDRVFTTNLVHRKRELPEKKWYLTVNGALYRCADRYGEQRRHADQPGEAREKDQADA